MHIFLVCPACFCTTKFDFVKDYLMNNLAETTDYTNYRLKCILLYLCESLLFLILVSFLFVFFCMWKPVWAWYYRVHIQSVRVEPEPASTSTASRGEESLHCHVIIASVLHRNLKLAKFFGRHLLVQELSIFRRPPLSFFSSCVKTDSRQLYSLFPHSTVSPNSFFPFKCISIWWVKSNARLEAS